jgi:enamine deaminase RidA (YjgF/YER057c/UK114 family)
MRDRYREGAGMEAVAGYCRAVRHGDVIAVSGTADLRDGVVGHPGDTYGQTRAALERSIAAVERLGGRREDIVRGRIYLAPAADWQEALRAHKELLGDVEPTNTTVVVGFILPEILVEVEIDAVVTE